MILLALIHVILVLLVALRILWRDDLSAAARFAWIIVVLLLPYFGLAVYVLFGEVSLGRTIHDRLATVMAEIREKSGAALGSMDHLNETVETEYQAGFRFVASVEGFATTVGNRAELMPDAQSARSRLVQDIDDATDHVHALYYIWLNDDTGTNVANALIRAAQRGVKCIMLASLCLEMYRNI